jgi:hypothetical protein
MFAYVFCFKFGHIISPELLLSISAYEVVDIIKLLHPIYLVPV